jgi:hypothetical protein
MSSRCSISIFSFGHREKRPCDAAPVFEFAHVDVVALVFGEAIDKHRSFVGLVREQRPIPAAAPLSLSSNTLLDKSPT